MYYKVCRNGFFVIVAVAICTAGYIISNNSENPSLGTDSPSLSHPVEHDWETISTEYVVEKLAPFQISRQLATKIAETNLLIFSSWYDYDRNRLDNYLNWMGTRLRNKIYLQNKLLEMPEMATLVIGAMSFSSEDAELIVRTIPAQQESKNIIQSLYKAIFANPQDAIYFAKLLSRDNNSRYIIELSKQSPQNIDLLPFFELSEQIRQENVKAGEVFRNWLYSLLDEQLKLSVEAPKFDDTYTLLCAHAETVAALLKSSASFRERFLTQLWPQLKQLSDDLPATDNYEMYWNSYYSNPGVWEFWLTYPTNGYSLYKKYADNAPAILMDSAFYNPADPYNSYQKSAREKLGDLMNNCNEEVQQALLCISPACYEKLVYFLNRSLDDDLYFRAFALLANADNAESGTTSSRKLDYWNSFNNKKLLKDDDFKSESVSLVEFVPGYDATVLISKALDGREVTIVDFAMAGLDTVFIAVDAVALITGPPTGGGSLVAVESLKTGANTVVKAGIKVGIKESAKILTRKTLQKEGYRFIAATAKVTRSQMRSELGQTLSTMLKTGRVDISDTVRYWFKNSQAGLQTYKKYTSLDARIFMRSDRRVCFDLTNAFKTKIARTGVNVGADFAIGAAGYAALNSEPGEALTRQVIERANKLSQTLSDDQAWESDLSAWWILNQ